MFSGPLARKAARAVASCEGQGAASGKSTGAASCKSSYESSFEASFEGSFEGRKQEETIKQGFLNRTPTVLHTANIYFELFRSFHLRVVFELRIFFVVHARELRRLSTS